ncbi:hypothetical protein, partial [Nocardia xishanensis]
TLAPQRYRHGADPIPREAEGDLIMNRYTNRTLLITGQAEYPELGGVRRAGGTILLVDLSLRQQPHCHAQGGSSSR